MGRRNKTKRARPARRGYAGRLRRRPLASARLVRALPPKVEELQIVQRALEVLERGEVRVREALVESEQRLLELFEAQRREVLRAREEVEAQLEARGDALLDRLGLIRKRRHSALLARARRRVATATRKVRPAKSKASESATA